MQADVLRRASRPTDEINVYTDSFTKGTAVAQQDITIPVNMISARNGSWAIIFWFSQFGAGATGAWIAHVCAGMGFVAKDSAGAIGQYAVGMSIDDAVATTNTDRGMGAKCLRLTNGSGGVRAEANFVSFPSPFTMRIDWTVNSAQTPKINYAIITGLDDAKVVNWTTPTTAIDKYVNGVGFSPDHVFNLCGNITSAVPTSLTSAALGFGMFNKRGQEAANMILSTDGNTGGLSRRWQRTDRSLICGRDGDSLDMDAVFKSMHATDGFTMNFLNPPTSAGQVASLCLKGITTRIGSFVKSNAGAPVAQTVRPRQNFIPKGLLFSNISLAPAVAASGNATWAFGANDLTRERLSAFNDGDAENPTQVDSAWFDDKAIGYGYFTGGVNATRAVADLTSAAIDSFVATWTTNDATEAEILYCLLGDKNKDMFPASIFKPADGLTMGTLTANSSQKKTTVLSSGRIVAIVNEDAAGTSGDYTYLAHSIDGWKTMGTYDPIAGAINTSIDSYTDTGGVQRIVVAWKQSGTGGGRVSGVTYAMVGTLNAGETVVTWGTATANSGGVPTGLEPDPNYNFPDIVVAPESNGGVAHVVRSYAVGGATMAIYNRINISNTGAITSVVAQVLSNDYANGTQTHTYPTIDMDPVTKRLFMAWSAGAVGAGKGVRFKTAAYSAGVWTWAAEIDVDTTVSTDGGQLFYAAGIVRWDAARSLAVVCIWGWTGSAYRLAVWDSSTFTSFNNRISDNTLSGEARFGAGGFAIDPATGDVYVMGAGNNWSSGYRKMTRAGAALTLGSRIEFDSGGPPPVYFSPFVNADGDIGFIYTHGQASPYSVKYDRILTP